MVRGLSFKELAAKLDRGEECTRRYYRPELPGYTKTNRKQAPEPEIQFLGRPCTTPAYEGELLYRESTDQELFSKVKDNGREWRR